MTIGTRNVHVVVDFISWCANPHVLPSSHPSNHRAPRHTEAAFFNSFGCPIHDLFSSFEPEPIASGSIGQIYRAVVGPRGAQYTGVKEGRTVAVKVRHPGVTDAIERDFSLMLWAAHVAAHVPGLAHLRLEDSLRQFAAPLREQVDFTLEALHLWQFAYNFRSSHNVHFPFPIYPLVSPEVLVETYEEGALVSEYVAKGDSGPFSKQLATMGCSAFLQMMLVDNLIHAGRCGVWLVCLRLVVDVLLRFALNLVAAVCPQPCRGCLPLI